MGGAAVTTAGSPHATFSGRGPLQQSYCMHKHVQLQSNVCGSLLALGLMQRCYTYAYLQRQL